MVPRGDGAAPTVSRIDTKITRIGANGDTVGRPTCDVDNFPICKVLTGKGRGVKCPQKGEYLVTNVRRLQRDQGTRFNRSRGRALQRTVAARESAIDAR